MQAATSHVPVGQAQTLIAHEIQGWQPTGLSAPFLRVETEELTYPPSSGPVRRQRSQPQTRRKTTKGPTRRNGVECTLPLRGKEIDSALVEGRWRCRCGANYKPSNKASLVRHCKQMSGSGTQMPCGAKLVRDDSWHTSRHLVNCIQQECNARLETLLSSTQETKLIKSIRKLLPSISDSSPGQTLDASPESASLPGPSRPAHRLPTSGGRVRRPIPSGRTFAVVPQLDTRRASAWAPSTLTLTPPTVGTLSLCPSTMQINAIPQQCSGFLERSLLPDAWQHVPATPLTSSVARVSENLLRPHMHSPSSPASAASSPSSTMSYGIPSSTTSPAESFAVTFEELDEMARDQTEWVAQQNIEVKVSVKP